MFIIKFVPYIYLYWDILLHNIETWKTGETVILSCINHDFVIVYEPAFNFVDHYNHVTTLKPSLYLS